jgi:hypothetical protein
MSSEDRLTFILFSVFLVLGVIGVSLHEMWRDELHSLLLAKNSSSLVELFINKRYEGHPGLWYLILYVLTRFSAHPLSLQVAHLAISAAAIFVFLRYSPFGRWQKTLFILGYFPLYEYTVISRNYSPAMLLIFVYCLLCCRQGKLIPISISLFLLAHTQAMATAISLPMALFAAFHLRRDGEPGPRWKSWNTFTATILIYLAGLWSSYLLIRVPADSSMYMSWLTTFKMDVLMDTLRRPWEAFVPIPADRFHFWNTNFVDGTGIKVIFSVAIILFLIFLFSERRSIMLLYISSSLILLLFFYSKVPGYMRHHGFLYLVLVMCLWLYKEQCAGLSGRSEWRKRGADLFITLLFLLGSLGGLRAYWNDLQHPFSAGKITAQFISNRDPSTLELVAEKDYAATSVLGYLGRKAFFPRGERFGDFVFFDGPRVSRTIGAEQVLNAAEGLFLKSGKDVLIIMNSEMLEGSLSAEENGWKLVKIAQFRESIVADEGFLLYIFQGSRARPGGTESP